MLDLVLLGIVLQLLNISYVEGLQPDFSNLVLMGENGSIAYSIIGMEEGSWALLNASLPEDYTQVSILASEGQSAPVDSETIEIPYMAGMRPDFSNLIIEIIRPDGSSIISNHSIIGFSEGRWAIVHIEPPLGENDTLNIYADAGQAAVPGQSGEEPAAGALPPGNETGLQGGNLTMDELWPLAEGDFWRFSDGRDSFELRIEECGEGCFLLLQSAEGKPPASIRLSAYNGTVQDASSGEPVPLFAAENMSWDNGNLTISISSEPGSASLGGEDQECISITRSVEAILPDGTVASASFGACFAPGIGPMRITRPDGRIYSVVEYGTG